MANVLSCLVRLTYIEESVIRAQCAVVEELVSQSAVRRARIVGIDSQGLEDGRIDRRFLYAQVEVIKKKTFKLNNQFIQ